MTPRIRKRIGLALQVVGGLLMPLPIAMLLLMQLGCGMNTTGCHKDPAGDVVALLVVLLLCLGLVGLIVWGGRMRRSARVALGRTQADA